MSLDKLGNPDLLTDFWIGGKAVPTTDGGRFDVLDLSTVAVLTKVADGSVEDALAAVDAADAAAAWWAATSPRPKRKSPQSPSPPAAIPPAPPPSGSAASRNPPRTAAGSTSSTRRPERCSPRWRTAASRTRSPRWTPRTRRPRAGRPPRPAT